MHFVPREIHAKECECKTAHVCLQIGIYLSWEEEVDLQIQFQDSDIKLQSLQVLTEQQAA